MNNNTITSFTPSNKAKIISLIIGAAILLEVISAVQYYYTKHLLGNELERRVESELTLKKVLVKSMLSTTENVLQSHKKNLEDLLVQPDSLINYFTPIIESNKNFVGSGMVFTPFYYPSKGKLYEPFAYRKGDSILVGQVASKTHDYSKMDFFIESSKKNEPLWSDPYLDKVGDNSFITSYTLPIHDSKNRFAALTGIDLSLEWLSDTLNNRHLYPSTFCLLLTEDGKVISKVAKDHPRHDDVDQAVKLLNSTSVVNTTSASGHTNVIEFNSEKDSQKAYVYYSQMKDNPHWRVALVCYDKEVYGKLYDMRLRIFLLMLLGFALLGYIIYRFIKNYNTLAKNEIEKQHMDSELKVAKRIQSEMLPSPTVDTSEIDIAGSLVAARDVGGDLYDYFIRDEKLFFTIGDASGKGVPSALIMSVTHSLFRAIGGRESNPARIMQLINHAVCQGNESNMFVTMFIGVLDLPTGRLHYCNAGHDTPIILSDNAKKLNVNANLPLAVLDDFFYQGQETILEPGMMLLLYTDGLTEAMNSTHEQFGLQRVMNVIDNNVNMPSKQMLDKLHQATLEFVGNAEQSDDLTMFAVRYTPSEEQTLHSQELTIENDLSHISQVNDFVTEFCYKLNFDKSDTTNMRLAIEEAVVNIINYAYPEGEKGDIGIVASATNDTLKWVITDNGKHFAPTDAPDVDTSLSAEDRQIGGLGIFLVRQLMDTINYERIDGKNVLTLKKKY